MILSLELAVRQLLVKKENTQEEGVYDSRASIKYALHCALRRV